jgi:putative FmdB family regulatory protein
MPTYEYKCSKCGFHFEKFQSIKDAPLKKCPECGKDTLKKLISGGAGLIFKGNGFYLTDYAKKTSGPKKETKTDKKESDTKQKPDTKKDQKK